MRYDFTAVDEAGEDILAGACDVIGRGPCEVVVNAFLEGLQVVNAFLEGLGGVLGMLSVKDFLERELAEDFSDVTAEDFFVQTDESEDVETAEDFGDVSMMFRACEMTAEGFFIQSDADDGAEGVEAAKDFFE